MKTFLPLCPFCTTHIPLWGYMFLSLPLSCDTTATPKTSRLISLRREHTRPNIDRNGELASHIPSTYGAVVSIKAYVRGKASALPQALRTHYLEKVTQTSYLGTDFLLIMTPTYVFLIFCLNRRSQSTENVDYKQKSCTQLNN